MQAAIRLSQVVMEESRSTAEPDRLLNVPNGDFMIARSGGNQAEQVEGVGLVGLGGENLPVDLLGGLQATALVVLQGNRQCFADCCHDRC